MDKIKTASGKVYDSDLCAQVPGMGLLYLRVIGASLAETAAVFGDPAETARLFYNEVYFAGYTRLDALIPEGDAIRVALRKE